MRIETDPIVKVAPVHLVLSELPLLSMTKLIQNDAFSKLDLPRIIPVEIVEENQYRWSIGVTARRFLTNPFATAEIGEDYRLRTSYFNVNVPISKRIGKHISIKSGLLFYKAKIDLSLLFEETYSESMPSESFTASLKDRSRLGALSINENESEINVIFSNDVDLVDGEILKVRAEIPVRLTAFSIPFSMMYTIQNKRFSYKLEAGISIDLFNVSIPNVELEAFNTSGRLVTQSVMFKPLSGLEVGGSLYFGAGINYELSKNSFGSFSLIVEPSDIKFTALELGLHHRF